MKLETVILFALVATVALGRASPVPSFELQVDVDSVDEKVVRTVESDVTGEEKDTTTDDFDGGDKLVKDAVGDDTKTPVTTTTTTTSGTSEVPVVRFKRAITCTDIVGANGETETVCDEDQDPAASEQHPEARSYNTHGYHHAHEHKYEEPKKHEEHHQHHYG
ncbi:lateral signaling target protein 2 homolog [Ochlerotatus camptorhynchus]|uniref:lateral signaling target protein 2 homolog n=1 Tax=Ochlerotatus camptorhynchus TaxID=644619 RepID=UPI0031DF962F